MSYNDNDVKDAFQCARRFANQVEPIGITEERVVSHLQGNCDCDVERCPQCGKRKINGVPRHTKDCPFERKH